jgi:hypothetical protein
VVFHYFFEENNEDEDEVVVKVRDWVSFPITFFPFIFCGGWVWIQTEGILVMVVVYDV